MLYLFIRGYSSITTATDLDIINITLYSFYFDLVLFYTIYLYLYYNSATRIILSSKNIFP